ncbi:hypothetical protein OZN62_05255 [Aurantiacibacter sp. MUD11]|uniref:hypothetical protein n=1 Tax=Aurantiacibacter sp. MUD11 TaxID=3003265 RepID=UPI0022AB0AB5|nr:hypothetical protein [Aurantiacibacter sp. MUD11]WAT18977.1 hypothetical protein OZN62_05255 [Aurantiacibacter sp. MUD11]
MRGRLFFIAAAITVPTAPALAGVVAAPGPEAGIGLGALAALGAGYTWMRARARRK